ncbi:MAG: hypothetical protein DWI58_16480 [Chloroflexi bacterium]|nr:MAG: hypothetical protein DWI58_16480 [Chloroflexota bacterium]
MVGQDTPDAGALPVLPAPLPGQGTWIGDEIQRAQQKIESLTREITMLQHSLKAQQDETARLVDTLQVVDGRTLRHEAGQEAALEVRQELVGLEERIAGESALRRDLAAQLARAEEREPETQRELQRVLSQIAAQLDEATGRDAAVLARQRSILEEAAERERDDRDQASRLEALERRLGALEQQGRHSGVEIARVVSSFAPLLGTLESVEARVRTLQADQRRMDDDVAVVRAIRDREEALLEVLEQQRVTRARVEDRLNTVEETVEEIRRRQSALAEEQAILGRTQSGATEDRRDILERIESQRDVVMEHLRRVLRASEETARRHIEEVEREIRIARALVTRLDEQHEDAGREQPL